MKVTRPAYWLAVIVVSLFAAAASAAAKPPAEDRIQGSVVKIFTVASSPSYDQPWQMLPQQMEIGSGSLIAPGRVLTNGHVIANATFVQVQREGDPNKYQARVLVAGHEADLALLEVADPKFGQGVTPLQLGDSPAVRDKVQAYGFPVGGDRLSITEGVVSRIEMGQYAHCLKTLPLIQISAAINPGNSGGPVIKDGKIVGVAFQGLDQAENVGYMIPPVVIRHFLKDAEDGKYDGFPTLGIDAEELENPSLRASLGLPADRTGVLVARVAFQSSAWGQLQTNDVIMSIGGQTVANDATIPYGRERILFSYALVQLFPGDKLSLEVWRDRKAVTLSVPLKIGDSLVSTCDFDTAPSYYIFGGLLFSPLTLNYLQTWGGQWYAGSPVELRYHMINDLATPERTQVVVLQMVLADEVNVGYHEYSDLVVTKVDGQPVKDLADLVQQIKSGTGEFVTIETEDGKFVVLARSAANQANPRILQRYQINSDRSRDLKK